MKQGVIQEPFLSADNSSMNIFERMKKRYPDAYPLLYTDMVIDVLFMIDILINFRTTYVKGGEVLITNPWKIALHYFKTYFLVDFVAAIPWELMISLTSQTDEVRAVLLPRPHISYSSSPQSFSRKTQVCILGL